MCGREVPNCVSQRKFRKIFFAIKNLIFNFLRMKLPINIRAYSNLGSLISKWVFDNWQFVLFLFMLLLFYIANSLYAERKVREIQRLEKEIKATRAHYMQHKVNLMKRSRKTNVIEEMKVYNLYISNERRKRIIIDKVE